MLNQIFIHRLDLNIIFAIPKYEKRSNIIRCIKSANYSIVNPQQIAIFI